MSKTGKRTLLALLVAFFVIFLFWLLPGPDKEKEERAICLVQSRYEPNEKLLQLNPDLKNAIWVAVEYPLCHSDKSDCWMVTSSTEVMPFASTEKVKATWVIDLNTNLILPHDLPAKNLYVAEDLPATSKTPGNLASQTALNAEDKSRKDASTSISSEQLSTTSPAELSSASPEVSGALNSSDHLSVASQTKVLEPSQTLGWTTERNGDETMRGPSGVCATLMLLSAHDPNKLHLRLNDGTVTVYDVEDTPVAMRVGRAYCVSKFTEQKVVPEP